MKHGKPVDEVREGCRYAVIRASTRSRAHVFATTRSVKIAKQIRNMLLENRPYVAAIIIRTEDLAQLDV